MIVPDVVMFLKPEAMSALASSTTALLAAPAPFVIPSSFSRSVSDMSAEPIMNDPVAVTFLNDPMSLSASTTTALLAVTVPAVRPSMSSSSDSTSAAEPTVNPVAVTTPDDVIAPEVIVLSASIGDVICIFDESLALI